jgi:hypothetical protein
MDEASSNDTTRSDKKIKLTEEVIKLIVKEANENNNNSLVARKYGMSESTVRKYRKSQSSQEELKKSYKLKHVREPQPKWVDLDLTLYDWFIKQRELKIGVM